MAAKKRRELPKDLQDDLRVRIQAGKAVDTLNKVIEGDEKVLATLTTARMKAIELALRKTVPDLQSVELSGNTDAPLVVQWGKPKE